MPDGIEDLQEDLCFLTATEAIGAFRGRSLSPVELARAVVERSAMLQPSLNALTYEYYERALDQACAAQRRYSEGQARPLEGVLVAIKDFHPVRDEITTYGSKLFRDHRPTYTAPYVQRLLDAGAILVSRTTTPEFAYDGRTHSPPVGLRDVGFEVVTR